MERDFAREIASAAVAPLEGLPLQFSAALEMATTNVAARIQPILDAASAAATAKERERAAKVMCFGCRVGQPREERPEWEREFNLRHRVVARDGCVVWVECEARGIWRGDEQEGAPQDEKP